MSETEVKQLMKSLSSHAEQDQKNFNNINVKLEVLLTRFEDHIGEQEKRDIKRDEKIDKIQSDLRSLFENIQHSIVLAGDVRSMNRELRETVNTVNSVKTDLAWLKKAYWVVFGSTVSSAFGFIFLMIRLFIMS